ncbi:hypothetical protein BOX15_Mlig018571g2 [Macrostomum lignano]|uniref:Uncharacterized protein n=1 Tax=Macrostomum lignano TaxID=282301 RepID=A0A267G0C0_9PLAT|nr:hypothetical protein BOX15_Mlig018571g2 [Macrostomum lignano]
MEIDSDTAPQEEKPSLLAQRMQMQLKQPSTQFISQSQTVSSSADHQHDLFISGYNVHTMPNFPNLGPLVRLNTDVRLARVNLRKFVSSDTLFYPFEVQVTIPLPRTSDFMWDFKHKFYLSIMYSQVYRFFFPFNRHNSQLFLIIDMSGTSEPLCVNVPSRTLLRNVSEALMDHEELGAKQFENCLMIAVSAYKDYAAFFRLSSKHRRCPDSYKNFCYVPPVWTNKLE